MTDLELSRLDQLRDTSMLHQYRLMTEEMGRSPQEALAHVLLNTRDRCRSPMQWSDAPQAGFCPPGVRPWLPVNPDYAVGVNVLAQEHDPQSLLAYYRRLLHLRRVTPALVSGHYTPLAADNSDVLAYVRRDPNTGQSCAVVLNFSAEPQPLLPDVDLAGARLLFAEPGVQSGPASASGEWRLLPLAVVILELAPQESQA